MTAFQSHTRSSGFLVPIVVLCIACILLFTTNVSSAPPVDPTGTSKGRQNGPYDHLLPFQVGAMHREFNAGQFFTHIGVGTPPRPFSVSISTSVSLLVLACNERCGKIRSAYDSAESSSHGPTTNRFSENIIAAFEMYNLQGVKVSDRICVGGACSPVSNGARLEFGCLFSQCPNEFVNQKPDGILGLSTERPSDNLLNSFVVEHKMKRRVFSMCIGKEKGALAIGGVMPQAVRLSKPQFGRMETSWSYMLHMRSIGLSSNNRIPLDHVVPLLTSVAHTFVPQSVFTSLRNQIYTHCKVKELHAIESSATIKTSNCGMIEPTLESHMYDQVVCVRKSNGLSIDQFMAKLPTIFLWVDGFQHDHSTTNNTALSEIAIKPEHYMIYTGDSSKWCSSIVLSHSHHMYIGSDVMRGHEWVFDLDRNEVSWTPAECDAVYAAAVGSSIEPPAHIATNSPTAEGDVACCAGTHCSQDQVNASLVANHLSLDTRTKRLSFTPTEEYSELNCLFLMRDTELVIEDTVSEEIEVSVCPANRAKCVFAIRSALVAFSAKNVLVGSLSDVAAISIGPYSHVRVNDMITIYNARGYRLMSSIREHGVLETTNQGSTSHHVKLMFSHSMLNVWGTLLFNSNADVACHDYSRGIHVVGVGENTARVHVRQANNVLIHCSLQMFAQSELVLEPWLNRLDVRHEPPRLQVKELLGDGAEVHFKLRLDLLTGRLNDGMATTPELTAMELKIDTGASRFFPEVIKVSLDANTIPNDWSAKSISKQNLKDTPKQLVFVLVNKELPNRSYEIDTKLLCMGAIVSYDAGYTELRVPFNPSCMHECARRNIMSGTSELPSVCKKNSVWRQYAALQDGTKGVIGMWVPPPIDPDHGNEGSGSNSSGRVTIILFVCVLAGVLCVAAYKRPRAAARLVTGPRRFVTTLLGGGEDSIGRGDREVGGMSEVVREMTSTTSRLPATPAPEPEAFGYELQES